MGTAATQGPLWGSRSQDWAAIAEPAWTEAFQMALRAANVTRGSRLLDLGCGSGVACFASGAK